MKKLVLVGCVINFIFSTNIVFIIQENINIIETNRRCYCSIIDMVMYFIIYGCILYIIYVILTKRR